ADVSAGVARRGAQVLTAVDRSVVGDVQGRVVDPHGGVPGFGSGYEGRRLSQTACSMRARNSGFVKYSRAISSFARSSASVVLAIAALKTVRASVAVIVDSW